MKHNYNDSVSTRCAVMRLLPILSVSQYQRVNTSIKRHLNGTKMRYRNHELLQWHGLRSSNWFLLDVLIINIGVITLLLLWPPDCGTVYLLIIELVMDLLVFQSLLKTYFFSLAFGSQWNCYASSYVILFVSLLCILYCLLFSDSVKYFGQ